MLPVGVTVQVQLSARGLRSNVCRLIYSLTHCLDSVTSSLRNKSVACASAGLTLQRQFFFEDTIYPDGQFPRSIIFSLLPENNNLYSYPAECPYILAVYVFFTHQLDKRGCEDFNPRRTSTLALTKVA